MPKTMYLYRWMITDPTSGRRHATRHRMTEADAVETDPTAQPIEDSLEVRVVADDPNAYSTSAWQGTARPR